MPRDDSVDRSLEVLVVDDDPDVRELLEEFFREMEFVVATAKDGRAAISAVEREPHRYWLVITDIVMPGADGLAVLRAVKTASPSLQVVIMTGYASLDTAIEAVRLGAADYLPKPFTLGQIEVMVRRLMERLHLERQNREMATRSGSIGSVTMTASSAGWTRSESGSAVWRSLSSDCPCIRLHHSVRVPCSDVVDVGRRRLRLPARRAVTTHAPFLGVLSASKLLQPS